MTTYNEGTHSGEFLFGSVDMRSRDIVTVLQGQKLAAGAVLGSIATGAATMTAYANNAANTGAAAAVTVGAGAKPGRHRITIIEPGSNAGVFEHEGPDGIAIKTGVVGQAYSGGGLSFTIPDGSQDFVAGEGFTIDVADGSLKVRAIDFASTVGADRAVGILLQAVDATDADQKGVAIVRDQAVVAKALLWPAGANDNQKNAALAQLKAQGIIPR